MDLVGTVDADDGRFARNIEVGLSARSEALACRRACRF
jgi:hypothetical protein